MSGRTRTGAAVLCVAVTLVSCRRSDTPEPVPAPGSQASGQTDSSGPDAGTPPKPPEFIPSPNNLLRVRSMVLAVTAFSLFHELGHMVISEYKIPTIFAPENTADRFAAFAMTPDPRPANSPPDSFDPATDPQSPPVMWAAWWWHEWWKRAQDRKELPNYANRHGLDITRSVEVMCLTYGSDPKRFEQPFRTFIPEDSREECVQDARRNEAAWRQVIAPVLGGGWWRYEGRVQDNPAPPGLETMRALLMESRMLEVFAERGLNQIPVPKSAEPSTPCGSLTQIHTCAIPIDLVGDPCLDKDGIPEVNASWTPALRQLKVCYALVLVAEQWSRETIARTEIGQREKMPDQR